VKLRSSLFFGLVAAATFAAVACGAGDDSGFSFDAGGADSGFGGSSSGSIQFGDGGATANATGVVFVHAAAFPAFRVCFENFMDLHPQPDAKTLPNANVVGVELGGTVRLGPIAKAPGKVYVIDRKRAAANPGDPDDKSCDDVLRSLDEGLEYVVAGSIDRPVGVDRVEAIVFGGCASISQLSLLGIPSADCGPAYDNDQAKTHGNMSTTLLTLPTTNTSTAKTLPVQITNVSPLLTSLVPQGEKIGVSFGDLGDAGDGGLLQAVAADLPLYDASAPVTLNLDQQNQATFGTNGFRIAVGTSAFKLDETLADIQQLSRPEANPTTYFVTPSNYAFFLLGDPRIARTFDDGGANPNFDARRAMHLLAVPVNDEQGASALGADAGDGG
jgi:hypothetical protein